MRAYIFRHAGADTLDNLAVTLVGRILFKYITDSIVVKLVKTENYRRRTVLAFGEVFDFCQTIFLGKTLVGDLRGVRCIYLRRELPGLRELSEYRSWQVPEEESELRDVRRAYRHRIRNRSCRLP